MKINSAIIIDERKVNFMGFIFEKVPEEDWELYNAMGFKNCFGKNMLRADKYTWWCADRERNAYLVGIGGGYQDMPYYYDLWWNGRIIRMEISKRFLKNSNGGIDVIWYVHSIPISEEIWKFKDDVLEMIHEAFAVNRGWSETYELNDITVKIQCEPKKLKTKLD